MAQHLISSAGRESWCVSCCATGKHVLTSPSSWKPFEMAVWEKMRVSGSFSAGSLLWTKETTRFGPLLAARLSSSLRRLISWRPQIKPNTCFANLECNVGSSCLTGLQLPGTLCKWRWKRIPTTWWSRSTSKTHSILCLDMPC